MTIGALVVSVETGINTVNAEKGPSTLPTDVQASDPISITIKDAASRLNNKLDVILKKANFAVKDGDWNDLYRNLSTSKNINIKNSSDTVIEKTLSNNFIKIKDGDWNDLYRNLSTSKNINIKNSSDTVIEKTLSNTTMGATDSAPLNFFEGNGDSVTWSLDYGGFTGLSTGNSVTPATASNVLAPNISGLIAAYEGNTFSGTTWTDNVGTYNTNAYRGTPSISSTQLNGYNILEGTTSDGLQFPSGVLPSTYTLFHVTRYNNGTRGRIFDGVTSNWLSGFHGNKAGVAYHNGWITPTTDYHGFDWVISTDQNSLYRSNGVQRGASGGSSSKQLGLNYGYYYASEPSAWQCAEVIVFNRTLTQTEYEQVEQYLSMKYSLPLNGTVATSWPFTGNFGNIPEFKITSSLQSSSITYNSTGNITIIEDNFGRNEIKTSKDFNTFSNLSFYNTEVSIETSGVDTTIEDKNYKPAHIITSKDFDTFSNSSFSVDESQILIKLDADTPKDTVLNKISIQTSDDISVKSPSFCNALQFDFYIKNGVPLGYFEVDGIAKFSDINKNNDPRLVGGVTSTGGESGGGETTTSGPIQTWSS